MLSRIAVAGVALTLATAAAVAIASDGGYTAPEVSEISVDLGQSGAAASNAPARRAKKPAILYLQGDPLTIDPAALGRYVDVRLFAEACTGKVRVIDGGVAPANTDVYQQGSYVPNSHEYHVLIGLDDGAETAPYQITSHLVCVKGVR